MDKKNFESENLISGGGIFDMNMKKKKKRGRPKKKFDDDEIEQPNKKVKYELDHLNQKIAQNKIVDEEITIRKVSSGQCYSAMIVIFDEEFQKTVEPSQEPNSIIYVKKTVELLEKRAKDEGVEFFKAEKKDVTEKNFTGMVKSIFSEKGLKEPFRKNALKLIVFYVGHGGTNFYEEYPHYSNEWGTHNTHEMFLNLKEIKLDLLIFVADCCSSKNDMLIHEEVKYPEKDESKISMFDFQGYYYIRSSQKGCYSYATANKGALFSYFLINCWKINWYKVIEKINSYLKQLQIATGEGKLIATDDRGISPKTFEWVK